jgi:hypothetical protein
VQERGVEKVPHDLREDEPGCAAAEQTNRCDYQLPEMRPYTRQ